MYSNIEKGLEKLDNPLIRQTVEFLIAKVEGADSDETCDIAKSALLMYLHAAAPGVLKADIAIEEALNKSFSDSTEESLVDSERLLKDTLAESGIYYFGPLDKHFRENPPKKPGPAAIKHIPVQVPHGNRPGKRTLIGLLAAWKKHIDSSINIPSRLKMITMSLNDVHKLAAKYIPEHVITGMGQKIRTSESHAGGELRSRAIDGSDAFHLRGRGKGLNMRDDEYLNNLLDMIGERPLKGQSQMVEHIIEARRTPGSHVVDTRVGATEQPKNVRPIPPSHVYHEGKPKNEGQVFEEKKPKKAGQGHESLGSARSKINRLTGKPRVNPKTGFNYPEYVPGKPEPTTARVNPFKPRKGKSKTEIDRLKREAALVERPPDVRVGADPLETQLDRVQNPLPDVITSLDQIKGTKMAELFAKLSREMKNLIESKMPVSPAKLNAFIKAAAISQGLITKSDDPKEAFLNRLEKMRAKKQGS